MKILFFTRRFYPDIGGVEKHVFEIGKRLVQKGHKITIITESQKKPVGKTYDINKIGGMEVYRIYNGKDNWYKKFKIWKNLWNLRQIILKADIIHCHDVFFWYLPFRFLYPSKPVYTTFHGYESFPIKKGAIIVRKISEILSWGNICIGDFIKKWYGTKPTFVAYGAVNTSYFKLHTSDFKKYSAVFMGRLDEQTGILDYVKAVEILKKTHPKFEFTVIGDGKHKKQIAKKVKVLGFKKNPEKYFYNYHFAFVSRYLSILEAFAAKKLVFAIYDNPVKKDYLKMSPFADFIIAENDPYLLANKINEILKNPKLENKMINQASQWVKKQTWENFVKLYLNLWQKAK